MIWQQKKIRIFLFAFLGLTVILALIARMGISRRTAQTLQAKPSTAPTMAAPQTNLPINPSASDTSQVPEEVRPCSVDSLFGTISFEGAAGTVYATATVKNTGPSACTVPNNTMTVVYDKNAVKNLSVSYAGLGETPEFTLEPGGTATATLRYPNGPQCGGGVKDAYVTYTYALAPEQYISFITAEGGHQFTIPVCTTDDITTITISGFSLGPTTY